MEFTFDRLSGRYRAPNGRYVKEAVVLAAFDTVIDAQAGSMRDQTQQLIDGTITLALWQTQMMRLVKDIHLVGLALGNGGWRSLGQDDFGWVGQRIREQYDYLIKFSVEISSGKQSLDGTALSRAAMYAGAGRTTHREAQRRLARAQMIAGDERRMLGIADHCRTCLQQARLKWQPFGTLKRIGDSECRVNCLPGDALVDWIGLEAGYRRFYDGPMITMRTMAGRKLSITPNHPVLTGAGWKLAGLLNVGDDLISGTLFNRARRGSDPNVDDGPAQIQEVVAALQLAGASVRVVGVAMDFHGDGMDGDIDVVWANRELLNGVHSSRDQHLLERLLADADIEPNALLRDRASNKSRIAVAAAPTGMLRGHSDGSTFLARHALHAKAQGFRGVPYWDASADNPSTDGPSGNPKGGRDSQLALATDIATDKIVDVQRNAFAGHVYNLQTAEGWYLAAGLIVHNCRCWFEFRSGADLPADVAA